MNQLEGRWARLRPVLPPDVPALYSLCLDPSVRPQWRSQGRVPPLQEFRDGLWSGVLAQFVIENSDGDFVGHAVSDGYDARNSVAAISVAVCGQAQGKLLGVEATGLILRYLFNTYPLRRIVMQASASAQEQYASAIRRGWFVESGLLPEQIYSGDRYEDLLVMYVDRSTWHTELEARLTRWATRR